MNNKNIESVLKLNNLVFDKINFERHGFKSDNEFRFEISSEIFEKDKQNCTMLTPEEWRKRSVWKRFVGLLAQMCTPFL